MITKIVVGHCLSQTTAMNLTVNITAEVHDELGKQKTVMLRGKSVSLNRQAAIRDALGKLPCEQDNCFVRGQYNNCLFEGSFSQVCSEMAAVL